MICMVGMPGVWSADGNHDKRCWSSGLRGLLGWLREVSVLSVLVGWLELAFGSSFWPMYFRKQLLKVPKAVVLHFHKCSVWDVSLFTAVVRLVRVVFSWCNALVCWANPWFMTRISALTSSMRCFSPILTSCGRTSSMILLSCDRVY